MGVETVITVGRGALELALSLAGPVLLFGLIAGLTVSVFQAMTQINEITLTFIPKIVATAAALVLFGPWMLARLMTFTTTLFLSLPDYVR
jgi:flagellar biosynthetic protein FliQ